MAEWMPPLANPPSEELTSRLVDRLRTNDPEAAVLLNNLYREALVRFCWGYLSRMEEAEDAVQEICLKILQSPKIPDGFRPWVYQLARNHCLNTLRERARHGVDGKLPTDPQIDAALTGQLTRLVNEEMRSKLAHLVAHLSDAQREVLRLRYVEGLNRGEIAEVLDISEAVVKSRLFEGLNKLREQQSLKEGSS